MRLSSKGRYAVSAMVDLAANSAERPVPLADIADRRLISLSYLEQMFAKLRRGGLVRSVRGPGGGYLLAADPSLIRISDIVLAVDNPITLRRRSPRPADAQDLDIAEAATAQLWDALDSQMHQYLSSVTLADLLSDQTAEQPVRFSANMNNALAAE